MLARVCPVSLEVVCLEVSPSPQTFVGSRIAGGYDAIFLLVVDDGHVIKGVESLWATWEEMSVCPLSAKQSDGGLQVEEASYVQGLRDRTNWV